LLRINDLGFCESNLRPMNDNFVTLRVFGVNVIGLTIYASVDDTHFYAYSGGDFLLQICSIREV